MQLNYIFILFSIYITTFSGDRVSKFVLMDKMYNGLNLTIKVPNYFEIQNQWVKLNLQMCLAQVASEILQDENNEPWNNSLHSLHNFM